MKLKQNQQKKTKQTNKQKQSKKQTKQTKQANKRHIYVPFVHKEAMSDLNMEHHFCQIYVRITHFKYPRY